MFPALVVACCFLAQSLWANHLQAKRNKKIATYNLEMQDSIWALRCSEAIKDAEIEKFEFDRDAADLILTELMAEIPPESFFKFRHLEPSDTARKKLAASIVAKMESTEPEGKHGNGEAHFKTKDQGD